MRIYVDIRKVEREEKRKAREQQSTQYNLPLYAYDLVISMSLNTKHSVSIIHSKNFFSLFYLCYFVSYLFFTQLNGSVHIFCLTGL